MKEVILSHDSEAKLYLVPDEVADHLERYCIDFAANWVWHGPENKKFLRDLGGMIGAVFDADDFIDYLSRWAFPEQPSGCVKGLGCYDYEIPEDYQDRPRFNF